VELYPDKPIYDIPAMPVCTGQELTDALLKQIEPFGATFHYWARKSPRCKSRTMAASSSDLQGHASSDQDHLHCRRCRRIPAAHPQGGWAGEVRRLQLFYRVKNPADFAGKNLVIVGGGDSALDWALNFVKEGPNKAESVILIHRRDGFKAAPASVAKMKELCDAYEMQFIVGQVTGFDEKDGKLTGAKVTGADGITRVVPLDMLLVFFGLSPKLGPIAEWGLDIERKQLKVDTEKFSTNVPGIFAVGDINTYPGKKKLILSGFHECALAAFGAAPFIFPEKKIHLQYTTTSPKLHKVLGVETRSSISQECTSARGVAGCSKAVATEKVPLNLIEVILAQGSKLLRWRPFLVGTCSHQSKPTCHYVERQTSWQTTRHITPFHKTRPTGLWPASQLRWPPTFFVASPAPHQAQADARSNP
jgi:thioredoxin reductase (NADPH)